MSRVAHPALASIAVSVFNKYMPTPNQIFKIDHTKKITARDLLNMQVPGVVSEAGIRKNVEIGLKYMEAWLRSIGCVPINYLMEDAATAEVSRSQLWQWAKHGVVTSENRKVTPEYNLAILQEVSQSLSEGAPAGNKFAIAAKYFAQQVTGESYAEFLTT